ncbi:MAG: hypothetical protein CVU99_13620 [Firmicutes bacterium HGW-Firmicutes-4]|jgi:aspartate aminotransferase/aminotransferase|nr:MAG: hypothetical protein CVU99_13620 [Firmicutes bacterium HGW-Firmicutes-4]
MNTKQLPALPLSDKVNGIAEALSIYINQLVYAQKRKGLDIVTLSLGEVFFEIPLFPFDQLNFESGYHYSDSRGLPELRQKIVDLYHQRYQAKIGSIDEVLISSGSKAIIYMVLLAVLNQGDEVLIHEPAWLSYQEQVKLADGVPVFIPFDCPIENFHHHFHERTKILILNNPNNPAGWVYRADELRQIYQQCRQRGIYLLVDEAYSDFLDDGVFTSLAALAPDLDGAVIVNSLSKNFGLSGWRIGYAIAEKRLMYAMLKLNQHLITCAPTILQLYLAEYFDVIARITQPQAQAIVKKRQRLQAALDQLQLSYLPGEATFYFFVSIAGFADSALDFCLTLLFKHGIAAVPGSAYGASTGNFIRISIGLESEQRIKEALGVIKALIDQKKADQSYLDQQLRANGMQRFAE